MTIPKPNDKFKCTAWEILTEFRMIGKEGSTYRIEFLTKGYKPSNKTTRVSVSFFEREIEIINSEKVINI